MQSAKRRLTRPDQFQPAFVEAFNAGDVDGVLELYEPDAAMKPELDRVARGVAQIRDGLERLMQLEGQMDFEVKELIVVDDIAYIANQWTLTITGKEGQPAVQSGVAHEVLRRGADGGWRLLIGNPWGDRVAA